MRALRPTSRNSGTTEQELDIPSGAKAPIQFAALSAGLKSRPFKNRTDSELSYNLQLEARTYQLATAELLLGGEGDEAGGAGGEGAADFLAGDGGVVAGEDGVDGAGAEGEVGVDGLGLVAGRAVEQQDSVEGDADAVGVVEAVELELAAAGDADVAQGDAVVDREKLDAFAGEGVCGVEEDGVFGVADADVVVEDVFDQASAGGVGLDADAVVGAVEGEAADEEPG